MVTRRRGLVLLLLWLAAVPARAGAETLGESGTAARASASSSSRLDLRGGLSSHDDGVTVGGQRNQAKGTAVTHLALAELWIPRRSPFGVAADVALERFALDREGATGGASAVTGFDVSSGAVARFERGIFTLDGQVGYGFMRVPFAAAQGETAAALQAHGPQVAAAVAIALAPFVALEARARALPKTFGAQHGEDAVSVRRYAIGTGARLGSLDVASLRLSALVDYELVVTHGEARDFSLEQAQHRVGLGLRVAWPAPVPVVAAPPPAPVELPPDGTVRGRVRVAGVGGAAPGAPLAGATVTPADGASVTTDAEGRFLLEGMPPVLTRIAVTRDGFVAGEEVVAFPKHGDVEIEILLHPAGPAPVGVLLGFVRGDDGVPVGATITVRELKRSVRADRKGRFRLEVPPGRYVLTIEAPSFEPQTRTVLVGSGEQNIFNLDLQRHR
jgi:hypothetical protein